MLSSLRNLFPPHFFQSTFWALMGNVVPMVAALAAIPFLLEHLGQERMGVFSLIWVVIGYFSFLDMGLGRAVTVAVAQAPLDSQLHQRAQMSVLGTATVALMGFGLLAWALLAVLLLVLGVPLQLSTPSMEVEVLQALLWMLPSLPLLLMSSALRGHLEGVQAFRALNLLRIPIGALLAFGPCLAVFLKPDLVWASFSILLVRLVHVLALLYLLRGVFSQQLTSLLPALLRASNRSTLRQLLSFGGWVTVSNVVGPVIVYVDRYLIGALVAASSVAYYALPFDLASRLPILVASMCAVLLPEVARMGKVQETTSMRTLVRRSSALSAVAVFLTVAMGWALTPAILEWWLGTDYVNNSTQIARILLLAFGVNALAQVPFTALQATGAVRRLAWLHLVELIPYALTLWWALGNWGLQGAAWACLGRSLLDYLAIAVMWRLQQAQIVVR